MQHPAGLLSGQVSHITGPGAAALKYDILTALLVTSAQEGGVIARLSLRLSLIITARFNWRRGTFAVGQKELARMWGVTERTAKREMAELRARGWIVIEVPAARGRVATYRIDLATVLAATMPYWASVGPDFVARMAGTSEPEPAADNVVPMHRPVEASVGQGGPWAVAAERLRAEDAALFGAWFSGLVEAEVTGGTLVLLAPSRFVADYVNTHYRNRLMAAILADDRSIRDVRVSAP